MSVRQVSPYSGHNSVVTATIRTLILYIRVLTDNREWAKQRAAKRTLRKAFSMRHMSKEQLYEFIATGT